jgi:hypothetical protein
MHSWALPRLRSELPALAALAVCVVCMLTDPALGGLRDPEPWRVVVPNMGIVRGGIPRPSVAKYSPLMR